MTTMIDLFNKEGDWIANVLLKLESSTGEAELHELKELKFFLKENFVLPENTPAADQMYIEDYTFGALDKSIAVLEYLVREKVILSKELDKIYLESDWDERFKADPLDAALKVNNKYTLEYIKEVGDSLKTINEHYSQRRQPKQEPKPGLFNKKHMAGAGVLLLGGLAVYFSQSKQAEIYVKKVMTICKKHMNENSHFQSIYAKASKINDGFQKVKEHFPTQESAKEKIGALLDKTYKSALAILMVANDKATKGFNELKAASIKLLESMISAFFDIGSRLTKEANKNKGTYTTHAMRATVAPVVPVAPVEPVVTAATNPNSAKQVSDATRGIINKIRRKG